MIILHLIVWVGLFIWYGRMRKKEKKKLYRKIFLFAVTGNLLGTALTAAYEFSGRSETGPVLWRGALGSQSEEEEWNVETETGERYPVTVTIPAIAYEEEEVQEFLAASVTQLDAQIFSSLSCEHVSENLDLVTTLPGSPVSISWESNHPLWIDSRGTLSDDIPADGAEVILTATVSLQGESDSIQRTITVYPPEKEESEKLLEAIQTEIDSLNQDVSSPEYILPVNVLGHQLTWKKQDAHTGILVMLFTLVLAVLFGAREIQENVQQKMKREQSLVKDYPEIISEIVLFMGAGLSMRRIFERIALDYRRKQEKSSDKNMHAGYEEILLTWQEMEHGASEEEAYEHLGERCKLRNYRTLSTILTQNLRKGNKGMTELLKKEAQDAQEERRRNAKVAGETAGTKMLFPMGIMLVVVFIILTVPAFLSFGA